MKRASDKAEEVIDLTDEPDEPSVKKVKTSQKEHQQSKKPKTSSSASSSSVSNASSSGQPKRKLDNLARQRQWMQMGWKGPKSQKESNKKQKKTAPPSRERNITSDHGVPGLMSFQLPGPDVFTHPSDQFRSGPRPDPESFRPVVDRLCSAPGRGQDTPDDWGRLSRDIWRHFRDNQQERRQLERKIELWQELYKQLHGHMDCGLFVTGSTFNGYGSAGCDMDMCIFPQGPAMNDKHWLSEVRSILRKQCRHFIRGNVELVPAKVPILKFYDSHGRLEVDLSCNNPTAARNTHLLHCYSQLDFRVRPLVLAVKWWAKENGINEARFQTLSSYTLSLMVIHFLQCEVSPPVLPCLQKSHPLIFNSKSDIYSLPYDVPEYFSENKDSVGQLFVKFFQYWTQFDTREDVASVRTGEVLRAGDCERFARLQKLSPGQWSARLLVEEPFERTNAARAVCSDEKWDLICRVFMGTVREIQKCDQKRMALDEFILKGRAQIGRFLQ